MRSVDRTNDSNTFPIARGHKSPFVLVAMTDIFRVDTFAFKFNVQINALLRK